MDALIGKEMVGLAQVCVKIIAVKKLVRRLLSAKTDEHFLDRYFLF